MSSPKHPTDKKAAASRSNSSKNVVTIARKVGTGAFVTPKRDAVATKKALAGRRKVTTAIKAARKGASKGTIEAIAAPKQSVSAKKAVELAKRAGILTPTGKLAAFYR